MWTQGRTMAKQQGQIHYLPETSCKNGHLSKRTVKKNECLECVRNRARYKYAADPEKFRTRSKNWSRAHPEYERQARKAWAAMNLEKKQAAFRAWRIENKDRANAATRRWKTNNVARVNMLVAERQKFVKMATPKWVDRDQIYAIYAERVVVEKRTGIRHDVDHIIPLR